MKRLRLNLHLPFFSAVIAMFIITVFGFIYFEEESIHEEKREIVGKFFNNLEIKSHYDTNVFSRFIDIIESDASIVKSFQARNKNDLFRLTKPLYEKLNQDLEVTHCYFILNDGTVF